MQSELNDVKAFHHHIGARVREVQDLLKAEPVVAARLAAQLRALLVEVRSASQQPDDLAARLALSLEETAEWVEAHAASDLTAAADAWGDRCYVLLGDAVATGLSVNAIFAEVHKSNMTKSSRQRDASGKGVKEAQYQPPALNVGQESPREQRG